MRSLSPPSLFGRPRREYLRIPLFGSTLVSNFESFRMSCVSYVELLFAVPYAVLYVVLHARLSAMSVVLYTALCVALYPVLHVRLNAVLYTVLYGV
nr:MAG: hypothetical protein [Apis mellifera filamentous virus]